MQQSNLSTPLSSVHKTSSSLSTPHRYQKANQLIHTLIISIQHSKQFININTPINIRKQTNLYPFPYHQYYYIDNTQSSSSTPHRQQKANQLIHISSVGLDSTQSSLSPPHRECKPTYPHPNMHPVDSTQSSWSTPHRHQKAKQLIRSLIISR